MGWLKNGGGGLNLGTVDWLWLKERPVNMWDWLTLVYCAGNIGMAGQFGNKLFWWDNWEYMLLGNQWALVFRNNWDSC